VEDLHRIAIQRYHEGSKTNMQNSQSVEYIPSVCVGPVTTGDVDLPVDSSPNWSPKPPPAEYVVRDELDRICACAHGQVEAENPEHVLYVAILSVTTNMSVTFPVFPGIELNIRNLKLRWDSRKQDVGPVLLDEEGSGYHLLGIVRLRKLVMRAFSEEWQAIHYLALAISDM